MTSITSISSMTSIDSESVISEKSLSTLLTKQAIKVVTEMLVDRDYKNIVTNDEDNSYYYNLKSSDVLHHLVGFISYSLNLGYDTNYRSDRFNLGASVGYTGSYYFVAAQLPYVQNELSGFNLNLTFSF